MSLKEQKISTKATLEGAGPSMADSPGTMPPNRSDEIFLGLPLPIIPPQDQTGRKDFSIPIKPTLRYYEGLDGAVETVVNRRVPTQDSHVDNNVDHSANRVERGADAGVDKNKYSENPDISYTLNGQWIRGT
jgi:hypothetical protein